MCLRKLRISEQRAGVSEQAVLQRNEGMWPGSKKCDSTPSPLIWPSSPLCLRFQIEWRSSLREDTPFNIQTPQLSCDLKSKNASQSYLNQDKGQKLDTSRSKTENYRKPETVAKLFVIIDQPIQPLTYFQYPLYKISHSFCQCLGLSISCPVSWQASACFLLWRTLELNRKGKAIASCHLLALSLFPSGELFPPAVLTCVLSALSRERAIFEISNQNV